MQDNISKTQLTVPRGVPGLAPITLEMTDIYLAESRLVDISIANPGNAQEIMGFFNNITNVITKYISWVEYEILNAQKYMNIARATVILDKATEELKKYPGMKNNEDFREALIARDTDCQAALDRLNMLLAAKAMLDSKAKSFVRAYYTCQSLLEKRHSNPVPNYTGTTLGAPQGNVMGAPESGYTKPY